MKTYFLQSKNVLLLVVFFLISSQINASVPDSLAINKAKTEQLQATAMIHRLEEIKNLDKSNLSRAERKQLRAEVKAIKSGLSLSGNGVYLSIGAIIIIILLLILLL